MRKYENIERELVEKDGTRFTAQILNYNTKTKVIEFKKDDGRTYKAKLEKNQK